MTVNRQASAGIVLHDVGSTWLPQTQTWMYSQVADVQRLGVDAHVACRRTENLDQFGVANIHCYGDEPLWRRGWESALRRLRLHSTTAPNDMGLVDGYYRYLVAQGRRSGARIVHSHFAPVGWSGLWAVDRLGVKHVVTFYGFDVNKLPTTQQIWHERYQTLFGAVDLVLCEGWHMARCVVALGCPKDKVKVQHLGVAVDGIACRPRQWRPGEPLKVLIAASFTEKKGIPFAIRALGELRREVPLQVTLIGDAAYPEWQAEKAKILAALDSSGVGEVTRRLGYQPHARLLEEAYAHHVFLQPSVTAADGDTEGGAPVALIEMLATGMPVVSTTHCDIPEVMGPELAHLLVPERDAAALADRLRWLTAHPEGWAALAEAGRRRVESEYHRARQAERLLAHYRTLCDG